MADEIQIEDDEHRKWSVWAILAAAVLLMMFGVIAVGSVRGCFSSDTEQAAGSEEKKKKEEEEKKKKAEFELEPPIVLPSEAKVPLPPVKPGHWATASQEMRANYRDFVGDSRLSIVNNQNQPYAVADTPYFVRSSRPVLLTKGRPKATQTTFFVPQVDQTINLSLELEERGLGFGMSQPRTPLTRMPSYQYHFVVLAKTPSRYSYVKTLDSVQSPYNGESDEDTSQENVSLHYRIVELGADRIASLPDNPLTWTGIAYMLWDDIDPGEPFPAEQKKALVDWLHWGGQLIINGPDSLDLLKGSFLDPYLPATNGGIRKIAADDKNLQELSTAWIISTPALTGVSLQPTAPWSGITLALKPGANFLPKTGELFAERQVGQGRVVVSAIRLSERDFINWRSGFESFFNACLLRRPPRKFFPGAFGDVTLKWADDSLKERRLDASLNTRLHYLTRDLGVATSYYYEEPTNFHLQQFPGTRRRPGLAPVPEQPTREYRPPNNPGGLGAWNDFSLTANAARASLRKAAGVEVPGADFVVFWLLAYLIALVPLNWLVFYTIGRVEWAWIAAPLIAIAGTWVIVQRAQLDIGFVRSQTEIGVLEQQPDHPRAHLSRYTALYTSLSTTYDFEFAEMTTLIAPFPNDANFQMLSGQGLNGVNFQRYNNVQLVGLPISSNSTGMVHSEQMLTLDGPIRIGASSATKAQQIENRSMMELHSACIVKRSGSNLEGRWIGDLLPGQSVPMLVSRLPANKLPFADDRAAEARTARSERLNLEPMFLLALDPKHIENGEMRLVARVDEVLPGQSITPSASQVRGATIVVVHLQYAPLPSPRKDANTRQEIKATDTPLNTGPIEL